MVVASTMVAAPAFAGPGRGCNKFDPRRAGMQCCKDRTNNNAAFDRCKAATKGRG